MAETPWAQQVVGLFFERRQYPTQFQCDQIARAVSGASDIHDVDTPLVELLYPRMAYRYILPTVAGGALLSWCISLKILTKSL